MQISVGYFNVKFSYSSNNDLHTLNQQNHDEQNMTKAYQLPKY
jgi:hypothetical protein